MESSAEPGSSADALIGRALGDFVVEEKLGEGGFASVYRAEQQLLRRHAVIKVLRQKHLSKQTVIQRFLREAQLASQLDHPYAAHIYAFGAEPDGLLWIAMELVRGTPLDRMLASTGTLPLERLVPLLQRICEVVQSAHERGIVHRDLKPANVVVLSRFGLLLPKLLDFGIAKQLGEVEPIAVSGDSGEHDAATVDDHATLDKNLTSEGAVLGSPHYMAPEQWLNKGVGPHTDVYALGIVAYEALTGSVPFTGRTVTAIARGHARGQVPPLGGSLPLALDAVLARAMAKRPADRFTSALDFAVAFHAASGLIAEPLGLTQLEEPVREAAMASAPQPIAEAVAALDAVRSVHQACDASWQLFRVTVRLLGIYALAARTRIGTVDQSERERELLRTLRRRGLSEREWVALLRVLVGPFVARREVFALPDLIDLFFDGRGAPLQADVFAPLLDLYDAGDGEISEDAARQLLGSATPLLSTMLRRLAFLHGYSLVVVGASGAQRWMGVRRPQRAQVTLRGPALAPDTPALVGDDGVPVLLLAPLVQIASPTPGAPPELFVFEGPGKRGARLVATPTGYAHDEEEQRYLIDLFELASGKAELAKPARRK